MTRPLLALVILCLSVTGGLARHLMHNIPLDVGREIEEKCNKASQSSAFAELCDALLHFSSISLPTSNGMLCIKCLASPPVTDRQRITSASSVRVIRASLVLFGGGASLRLGRLADSGFRPPLPSQFPFPPALLPPCRWPDRSELEPHLQVRPSAWQ